MGIGPQIPQTTHLFYKTSQLAEDAGLLQSLKAHQQYLLGAFSRALCGLAMLYRLICQGTQGRQSLHSEKELLNFQQEQKACHHPHTSLQSSHGENLKHSESEGLYTAQFHAQDGKQDLQTRNVSGFPHDCI